MTGPRRPQTYSHPINAQTLTGVCQVVRMFSPCQFQVYIYIYIYISIGTLKSDLLSQSSYYKTRYETINYTNRKIIVVVIMATCVQISTDNGNNHV